MKHKIIIVLILLLPNTLFGTNWADEFPIHVYGDVSYIAYAFDLIKALVEHNAIEVIIGLGFTITTFIAGIKLKDADLVGFGKSMIAPITLLALFFTPTSTVHIVDIRVDKGYIDHHLSPDGGYQKIEDVPWAISMFTASTMLLVNLTIDVIDESSSQVHTANKFSSIGFQEISRATREALNLGSFVSAADNNSSMYEYDLNTYLKECIIKNALEYKANAVNVYSPTLTYPDNLNPANFNVNFGDDLIDYIDYHSNAQINNMKCSDAYTILVKNNSSKVLNSIKTKIETLNPTKDFTSASANEAFRQQIGDTANVVGTLQKAVATTTTARLLQKQQSLDAVGVDGYSIATELTIDNTLATLRSEGPAKFEWLSRALPDILFLLIGIIIAAYPLLIVVQSFFGATAYTAIANYFMGFFALYFNMVGLTLVQSMVSFYTVQEAQQSISIAMNMPFSIDHISDFMLQQADMAGLAGLVGAASVFTITPLIFYGETKGFSMAMSAATGAFKGNIGATASNTVKDSALEAEIDRQLLEERNGMTEEQASKWLDEEGFSDFKRPNMSSLDTYNQIMRGYSNIGSGMTAEDLHHSGNVPDYIQGSYTTSTQQTMKTVGVGSSIDSVHNAGEVAMQDGQVMAESINATSELRTDKGYDTHNIGSGMAMQQYAKDMGAEHIGSKGLEETSSLVANEVNKAVQQLSSGKGIIDSGGFKEDGSFNEDGSQGKLLETGYYNQSRTGVNKTMGMGLNGEVTTEQMTNTQTSSYAAMLSEFQDGRTLKENFGHKLDKNGTYESSLISNQDEIDNAKETNRPIDSQIAKLTKQRDSLIDATDKTKDDNELERLLNEADKIDEQINNLKSQKLAVPKANIETSSESISFNDMIENETKSKLAGRMGSANAFDDIGFDTIAINAQFGATSQALSTAAKIATQGGVDKAVATDVAEASMKAAMQQGATRGQIEELAKKAGMDNNLAKQFSSEIIKGSQEASELIKNGITDAGKELSFAMSASKTGSDIAMIDQAGGSDSFIERSKSLSTLKSENDNLNLKAQSDANIIDSNGNITSLGINAMAIPHIEKANAMIGKKKVGDTAEDIVKNAREQAFKEGMIKFNNNKNLANEYADGVVAPYYENGDVKSGNILTGNEFWAKQSELKAGVFSGSNTMAFGNAHTFAGVLSQDGQLAGKISGGLSSSFDKSSNYTEGTKINTNLGNAQTVGGQKAREATEHMFSPQKLAGMMVGKSFDEASTMLQEKTGMDKESADTATTAALMGGAALTVAGATELSQRAYNYAKGNYRAKEGFMYQSGVEWELKDGEPVAKPQFKDVKAGQMVNVNSSPELKDYFENNKGNFNLEKGTPGKIVGNLNERAEILKDSLIDKFSPTSFSTEQETINKSTSTQDGNTQNKETSINKNSTHSESPSSNFDSSISQNNSDVKNPDTLKEKSISQQIDTQTKYDQEVKSLNDSRNNELKNLYQNLENNKMVASSPDTIKNLEASYESQKAQINSKYESKLNDAKHQYYQSSNFANQKYSDLDALNADVINKNMNSVTPQTTMNNVLSKGADALRVAGVAGAVDQGGGVLFDMFSSIQKAGQNYYKTGDLDLSGVQKSFASLPATAVSGALDLANMAGSAVTASAISTFGKPTFSQAFDASFDRSAKMYEGISQYASNGVVSQMMSGPSGFNNTFAPQTPTLGTINPSTGSITPNYSYQAQTGQNLPSFFDQNNNPGNAFANNSNPFASNTSQIIADGTEDNKSYMRDMNDSIESFSEQQEEFMEFIRAGIKN
jgi:hypothetical protein